jgi:hypothetical protein
MRYKKGGRSVLILAVFFVVCSIVSLGYAESQIKMWMNQTVYVPIYSHIYLSQEKKIKLDFSAFLSIRNTDSQKAITLTSVDFYSSEGVLLKKYIPKPKQINPMSSTYFVIEISDTRGGFGDNFIVKWEAANKVTEPFIEVLHTGVRGSFRYTYNSRGVAIKGVYE